ncbi:MAG: sporulation integral membrane protein YtvI [Clostridia bacterium]|nr:sporulation integral membrane protein YtvI [Clostridia bacterium]
MKISENVKKVLIVSAVVLAVVLLLRFAGPFCIRAIIYLFGLLSPFVIGYIIARAINPVADRLHKWMKIPRGISAVLVIILTVGVIGGLLGLLGHKLFEEIKSLFLNWEDIVASLRENWRRLSSSWGEMYIGMPDFVKNVIDKAFDGMYKQSIEISGNIPVVNVAQEAAKSLPAGLIWTIMFILSMYFMVSRKISLTNGVRKFMGDKSADKLVEIKTQCKTYLGGYVKAQLILMVIVFFVILVILSLANAPFSLLIAALAAILDALPFFGSGIVLWPMAIVYFIDGRGLLGAIYVITYFVIMLLRRFIEPKLVSDKMGFDNPIIMLVAMYIGYKFWGVIGLIGGPLILMLIISLYKVGLFNRLIAILKQFGHFIAKEARLFEKYMHDITQ